MKELNIKNANIERLEAITFSNQKHLENFIKYLFNQNSKHYNEYTKYNQYFGIESDKLVNLCDNEIYMNQDEEQLAKIRNTECVNLISKLDNYKKISADIIYFDFERDSFENNTFYNLLLELNQYSIDSDKEIVYVVLHLNQGQPHFHRIFKEKK